MLVSVPLEGFAKTRTLILTNVDFALESSSMKDEVLRYYHRKGIDDAECLVIGINTLSDFLNIWNHIKEEDMVIINTHGDYSKISGYLTSYVAESLNYIYCRCVWILGCNCGHSHYENENIAAVISKRVSGIVVASDGTVESLFGGLFDSVFISEADKTWKSYKVDSCNTKQKGWVYYSATSEVDRSKQVYTLKWDTWFLTYKTKATAMNTKSLTVQKLMKWVDNYYGT